MGTKVYGCSDDLVEFEGDITGEVGCYGTPCVLVFSDGTVLSVEYKDYGVWRIIPATKGTLFEEIDICPMDDEKRYSDTCFFRTGLTSAFSVNGQLERVR